MIETFIGSSETLRESSISVCTKVFSCFNNQNYLFNLSRTIETIELLKRNLEFSIILNN